MGARLARVLLHPASQREVFTALRIFVPNLALSKRLVAAYDNTGTVIVTRAVDVIEVLDRDADFAVVYEPKMRLITGGDNFFLGMQGSARYQHDTAIMRLCVRRDDVAQIVQPSAARSAACLAAGHPVRIDLPQDLTLRVPCAMVSEYFGLPGPEDAMIDWSTLMFWYLFVDLAGDAALDRRALAAAEACRAWLDDLIARRKAEDKGAGAKTDDVLGRCLILQAAMPDFDDLAIRNNLIGLFIGAIPTLSKAACLAVDQLLERPAALAAARTAALVGDDDTLAACIFEALRFNPVNPIIYRQATRDCVLAPGTLRSIRIRRGAMVLASNLSAMFDPARLQAPDTFRTDRPWGDYLLWGYGMHTCFGAHINRAVIPAMLKPILSRPGLRRAVGAAGLVDCEGTPFPRHFVLESD